MSSFRYILVTLLKILVVISLVIILFVVGTMIGYGLIGNGNPMDVFDEKIWTHIMNFFNDCSPPFLFPEYLFYSML